MEPTIVYKKGGIHRGPKGIPFSYKGVSNEAEFLEAIKDGWYETLPDAVEPPKKAHVVKKKPAPKPAVKKDELD